MGTRTHLQLPGVKDLISEVIYQPPASPDSNPLDFYLWHQWSSVLQTLIEERGSVPKTTVELKAVLSLAHHRLMADSTEEIRAACMESFPKRLRAMKEAQGGISW